jgi:hypothetical protein
LVLVPQPLGFSQGIDFGVLPPDPLVAGIMERSAVRLTGPLTSPMYQAERCITSRCRRAQFFC